MNSTDETLCGIDAVWREVDFKDRRQLAAAAEMFLELTGIVAGQFRKGKEEQFTKFWSAFDEAITEMETLTGHRLRDRDGERFHRYGELKPDTESED